MLLCPLCPHLVGGLGDHSCIKSAEKPFISGYFHAREASAVSKRTGIVYIAGEAQPCKASHDKTEPRPPCLLRYDTSLVRSCTRLIRSYNGNWLQSQKIWAKKNRPPCQKAQRAKFYLTRMIFRSLSYRTQIRDGMWGTSRMLR